MSQPGDGEQPPPYSGPPSWHPEHPSQYGHHPGYPPPQYGPQPPGFQQGYPQQGYPPYAGPQGTPPGMGMPPAPPYAQPGYGYGYYGLPPAPVPGGRLASMGARLGGLLLDAVILAVPVLILAGATGAFHSTRTCTLDGGCTRTYDYSRGWAVDIVAIALGLAYTAFLVGTRGQTIGHRAAGIRVVDLDTGNVIGPGRAALRWIVLGLTGAICTLGYWSPFFDSVRRQGWHDKATNSVVIPSR